MKLFQICVCVSTDKYKDIVVKAMTFGKAEDAALKSEPNGFVVSIVCIASEQELHGLSVLLKDC